LHFVAIRATVCCIPTSEQTRIELPRIATCAANARACVERELGSRVGADALVGALLVTSELVGNAYMHGSGAIELCLALSPGRLRITVFDEGTVGTPAIRDAAGDETGGWGLRVVDSISLRWGVGGEPTRVWADLAR
jgi:anti-sigma regulatory factor (Ser/Thr protein kinase)